MDTLSREHPAWPDFCRRLLALVPKPPHAHSRNRSATRVVLEELHLDIEPSLAWLTDEGGRACDCEVIMNVILRDVQVIDLDGPLPPPFDA